MYRISFHGNDVFFSWVLLDFSLVYSVLILLIYGFIRNSLIVVAENNIRWY